MDLVTEIVAGGSKINRDWEKNEQGTYL